jgi:two-component system chemotaxis sensor kinase CheA
MFNDQKLLKRLLATFRGEARDHLQTIAAGLLHLEKQPADAISDGVLDEAFRAAHSLKGAARTVNVAGIETACQSMENVFSALKRGELEPSAALLDDLHRSLSSLDATLQALDRAGEPPRSAKPDADPGLPGHQAERMHASDTVRVDIEKLEAILAQAEELVSVKLAAGRLARELSQLRLRSTEWERRWARIHDDVRQLQQNPTPTRLERVGEFLEWSHHHSHTLHAAIGELSSVSEREHRHAGAMIDTLLDDAKAASMLPFSSLVLGFPRLVRELSRELGKEVDLQITGGEVEVDRRVLDEMKDPITHLVRNCVDHGIESAVRRAEAGKPPKGKIAVQLKAIAGNQAELMISDDGAGIDIEKLNQAASRLGLQQAIADPLALIFSPGVSTSPIVTDISGRGLGMAIVKERVERLGGEVSVESKAGQGTAFRMVLPLSMSRFRGLLVKTRSRMFVLPVGQIDHVLRVPRAAIKTVQNRETVNHAGTPFVLLSLSQVLQLRGGPVDSPPAMLHAVIVGSGSQRLAFQVDEILHEQEVLVKPLGRQLARVRNIAGAAILEDAAVVPILHIGDLMKSAARIGPSAAATAPQQQEKTKHSILVAEDSITSRTLLKGILETAGYRVETAVDGVDAFTKLRAGQFDLIVSDVDMPRLNGFGLTARIRADTKLAELPVVLVTALDSRADREHGVDVGANAYIVKGSFDQGNLLEAIRRLV